MEAANQNAEKQLPVALIGAGNFARHQHLPNLARLPMADLSWVCDLDEAVLAAVEKRYQVRTSTSLDEVLDDASVRAVVIALRDDLQAAVSRQALAAGKHVYVEKPLARTAGEAEALAKVVRETGNRLAVGYNRRYAPMYRKIKDVVKAHGIGSIHFRMCDDAWRWGESYEPGFLMGLDIGHLFDMARWLTGAEASSVCCLSSRPDDDQLMLRMANGSVVSIMLSGHGSMDMPKERCEIMGKRGGLIGEDFVELRTYGSAHQPYRQTFPGHDHPDYPPVPGHLGADGFARMRREAWEARQHTDFLENTHAPIPNFMRDQGWMASLATFIDGVLDDQPTDHATVHDALAAARILEAAQASREIGKVVRLD